MCKCYPQIHEDAASIKNEQLERNYGNRKKKNWQKIFKKENWQSKEIDLLNWSSILPNFFSLSFFYLEESIQIVFWIKQRKWKVKVKVTQSCLTLCRPHGTCQVPLSMGFSGQNTGMGSLSLLQGSFPIQGSNPGLLHCRLILYLLSYQGSLRKT